MSSKEEAISRLKKSGYQVAEDNSMVTVLIPASVSLKTTIKEVKAKLKEMEYDASFGVRQYKDGSKAVEIAEQQKEVHYKEEDTQEEVFIPQEDGGQFSLGDFGIGM